MSRRDLFNVTLFASRSGTRMAPVVMTMDALKAFIKETPSAAAKNDLQLLKFAIFGDKRTEKNCLRTDANVLEVTGFEVDYDAGTMPMKKAAKLLKRAGIEVLFYSSPSATSTVHKWRAICRLRKPITGTEQHMRTRRQHYVGILNALLGGVLAPESFRLSQAFYYGRIKGRPVPTVILVPGRCIDEAIGLPAPIIPASSRKKKVQTPRRLSARALAQLDAQFAELIGELQDLQIYRGRKGSGTWHVIRCPWNHRHTDPDDDEAAISEPTAANDFRSAFHCFHSHCAGLGMQQLLQFLTHALIQRYRRRTA